MFKKILLLISIFQFQISNSQSLYFPPTTGTVWDTTSMESLGWCRDKTAPLFDYLQTRNSKAFIVLKDGKIVIEKYFDKFTKDSLWYWASAGKTLTAFAVGLAQEDGFLKLSDTSSKYLGKGWMNGPQAKEDLITLRHHLTMTTGLDDGVPENNCTLDTCLKYKADAGSRWAYHNGPYTLLDKVIETSTGKSLNLYLSTKLKTPTGMNGLFIKLGYDNVYISNARSFARFGLLMLNKGDWNGTKIMKDQTYYTQMTNTSQSLNNSYGYLWWLNGKNNFMVPGLQLVLPGSLNPNSPADMYSAMGKNGQLLNIIPSQNLVVIRMGNAPNSSEVPFLMNDTIFIKLKAVMCKTGEINLSKVETNKFSLYPNPISNYIMIESLVNAELTVYTISGQEVFKTKTFEKTNRINTSSLLAGVYIFSLKTEDGCRYFRVVKD
jgi:CubicO group peptidase (beta-lactamase class C family)